jgi:hypothetical protein
MSTQSLESAGLDRRLSIIGAILQDAFVQLLLCLTTIAWLPQSCNGCIETVGLR